MFYLGHFCLLAHSLSLEIFPMISRWAGVWGLSSLKDCEAQWMATRSRWDFEWLSRVEKMSTEVSYSPQRRESEALEVGLCQG